MRDAISATLWLVCATMSACGSSDPKGDADETGSSETTATEGTATSDSSATAGSDTSTSDTSATAGSDTSTSDTSATAGSDTSTSDTSATGSGTDGGETGDGGDACGNVEGQLFVPTMPWNQSVTTHEVAADSAAIIDYLQSNVTSGVRFQIDFSLLLLEADATTPRYAFDPTDEFYSPDCDPAAIPIPAQGHIEGEEGYTCDGDGDCHLLVVDRSECRLYEQWRADFAGANDYVGGCLAVWDLDRSYDETLRGDYCTSADAAGLPISALLFTPDEVSAGAIEHAIRFIVPNANIRADRYVRPGTHSTPATSGPQAAPPYSAWLRLRSDADLSDLNPAALVVAEALQTYGMILADAGNVTFTASADHFTAHTWEEVGLGPHDLKALEWSDFEVLDMGEPIEWSSGDCQRTPISERAGTPSHE